VIPFFDFPPEARRVIYTPPLDGRRTMHVVVKELNHFQMLWGERIQAALNR